MLQRGQHTVTWCQFVGTVSRHCTPSRGVSSWAMSAGTAHRHVVSVRGQCQQALHTVTWCQFVGTVSRHCTVTWCQFVGSQQALHTVTWCQFVGSHAPCVEKGPGSVTTGTLQYDLEQSLHVTEAAEDIRTAWVT